jgi:pimeloyl-ACP methyl ester carboxylesterase
MEMGACQIAGEKLDPREEHFRIPSNHSGRSIFLRYLPSDRGKQVVLYVHGGTFPSALSVAHRFDGRSWRDELCDAGFHVWALDFRGFGRLSDPFPEMDRPVEGMPPLGRAEDTSRQLEQAVHFMCERHALERLSIIAHSWGTIATGRFAGRSPGFVDRLVFFGPIAQGGGRTAHSTARLAADLARRPMEPLH